MTGSPFGAKGGLTGQPAGVSAPFGTPAAAFVGAGATAARDLTSENAALAQQLAALEVNASMRRHTAELERGRDGAPSPPQSPAPSATLSSPPTRNAASAKPAAASGASNGAASVLSAGLGLGAAVGSPTFHAATPSGTAPT